MAAKRVIGRQSVLWKLFELRSYALSDAEKKSQLSTYVDLKGRGLNEPEVVRHDLMRDVLRFLQLPASQEAVKPLPGQRIEVQSHGVGTASPSDTSIDSIDHCKVLLLIGGAGSGKSTFGLILRNYLWAHFETLRIIPIQIPLASTLQPEQLVVERTLSDLGFGAPQIKS